jgi:hypothetical protein
MAQTKRKRRSKHRGTPAGTIEARGRTGRKPSENERKTAVKDQRQHRLDKPPTWNQSIFRAAFASVLLFVFTQVGLGPEMGLTESLMLCLFAMAIYVPLGYLTDRALYNRRTRKRAQQRTGK